MTHNVSHKHDRDLLLNLVLFCCLSIFETPEFLRGSDVCCSLPSWFQPIQINSVRLQKVLGHLQRNSYSSERTALVKTFFPQVSQWGMQYRNKKRKLWISFIYKCHLELFFMEKHPLMLEFTAFSLTQANLSIRNDLIKFCLLHWIINYFLLRKFKWTNAFMQLFSFIVGHFQTTQPHVAL